MPMDDKGTDSRSLASTYATLERIAATLGCPAEALMNGGKDPVGAKGASELLTIWVEMDDDGDRERLLEFARQLAAGGGSL